MTVRILLILGVVIGLYAVLNNIFGLFNLGTSDPILVFGKFLIALFPVIAGIVIVFVALSGLFGKKEGGVDEKRDRES